MKQPKRKYRNDMSDAQKQAISRKLTGRTLPQSTKDRISKSMTDYWNSLPLKPTSDNPYGDTEQASDTY
ncbi:MAG: hypothetical protein J5705_00955 [Bacteroidaceae bacterium]|nr:hypothetical protein [Bacteroidaceae bacterium]